MRYPPLSITVPPVAPNAAEVSLIVTVELVATTVPEVLPVLT
jgi:hypothetical protein